MKAGTLSKEARVRGCVERDGETGDVEEGAGRSCYLGGFSFQRTEDNSSDGIS